MTLYKKRNRFTFEMTKEMREQLKELSDENYMSMTDIIRCSIEYTLNLNKQLNELYDNVENFNARNISKEQREILDKSIDLMNEIDTILKKESRKKTTKRKHKKKEQQQQICFNVEEVDEIEARRTNILDKLFG